ncbi:hypothetical protein [Pseudomonas lalucatii]|uniref:hypothetical protein n=1 Tax=Pseudomonas lalucatii TaxID=1424203 RepID=UPI001BCCE380|nr:hypothetical protein [Pseudomonas lalucatii]
MRLSQIEDHLRRQAAILGAMPGASMLITVSEAACSPACSGRRCSSLREILGVAELAGWRRPAAVAAGDLAFLQAPPAAPGSPRG